jgi:TP901 family phage tail tape measure protein
MAGNFAGELFIRLTPEAGPEFRKLAEAEIEASSANLNVPVGIVLKTGWNKDWKAHLDKKTASAKKQMVPVGLKLMKGWNKEFRAHVKEKSAKAKKAKIGVGIEIRKGAIEAAVAEVSSQVKAAGLLPEINVDVEISESAKKELAADAKATTEAVEKALRADPISISLDIDEKDRAKIAAAALRSQATTRARLNEQVEQGLDQRSLIEQRAAVQRELIELRTQSALTKLTAKGEAQRAAIRKNSLGAMIAQTANASRGLRNDLSGLEFSTTRLLRRLGFSFTVFTAGVTASFAAIGAAATVQFGRVEEAANRAAAIFTSSTAGAQGFDVVRDRDALIAENAQVTEEILERSRDVALRTNFDTQQIAEGFRFLAGAGVDYQQALEGILPVAEFAQAGNIELEEATELLVQGFVSAGLPIQRFGEELVGITDKLAFLAQTAPITMTEGLQSFANGAAAVTKAYGQDITEAINLVGIFGRAGFKGLAAGTQISILIREISKSASIRAPEAFEKYGVALEDADGTTRSFASQLDDLAKVFFDMTDGFNDPKAFAQLKKEFGLTEKASRAFQQVLPQIIALQKSGSSASAELSKVVEESTGRLQLQSDLIRQTLSFQFGQFLDGIKILAEEFAGPFADSLTDFFKQINGEAEGSVDLMDQLRDRAEALGQSVVDALGSALDDLRGAEGARFFNGIIEGYRATLSGLTGLFTEFRDEVFGPDSGQGFLSVFGDAFAAVGRFAERTLPDIGRALGQVTVFIRENKDALESFVRAWVGVFVGAKFNRWFVLPLLGIADNLGRVYALLLALGGSKAVGGIQTTTRELQKLSAATAGIGFAGTAATAAAGTGGAAGAGIGAGAALGGGAAAGGLGALLAPKITEQAEGRLEGIRAEISRLMNESKGLTAAADAANVDLDELSRAYDRLNDTMDMAFLSEEVRNRSIAVIARDLKAMTGLGPEVEEAIDGITDALINGGDVDDAMMNLERMLGEQIEFTESIRQASRSAAEVAADDIAALRQQLELGNAEMEELAAIQQRLVDGLDAGDTEKVRRAVRDLQKLNVVGLGDIQGAADPAGARGLAELLDQVVAERGGQIDDIATEIADLQEGLLSGEIEKMEKSAKRMDRVFNTLGKPLEWLEDALGMIRKAAGPVLGIFSKMGGALKGLGTVVSKLAGPIGWLISLIEPLFFFFKGIWDGFKEGLNATDEASDGWRKFGEAVSWTWNEILKPILNALLDAFNWVFDRINDGFYAAGRSIGEWAAGVVNTIGEVINAVSAFIDFIAPLVKGAVAAARVIWGAFAGLWNGLKEFFSGLVSGWSDFVFELEMALRTMDAGAAVQAFLEYFGAAVQQGIRAMKMRMLEELDAVTREAIAAAAVVTLDIFHKVIIVPLRWIGVQFIDLLKRVVDSSLGVFGPAGDVIASQINKKLDGAKDRILEFEGDVKSMRGVINAAFKRPEDGPTDPEGIPMYVLNLRSGVISLNQDFVAAEEQAARTAARFRNEFHRATEAILGDGTSLGRMFDILSREQIALGREAAVQDRYEAEIGRLTRGRDLSEFANAEQIMQTARAVAEAQGPLLSEVVSTADEIERVRQDAINNRVRAEDLIDFEGFDALGPDTEGLSIGDTFDDAAGSASSATDATSALREEISNLTSDQIQRGLLDWIKRIDALPEGYKATAREAEFLGQALPVLDRALEKQRQAVQALDEQLQGLQNTQLEGTNAFSEQAAEIQQQVNKLELTRLEKIIAGADPESSAIAKIDEQLEKLQQQARLVSLREAVELDPLRRELDQLFNPLPEEMSFEEIKRQFEELDTARVSANEVLTQNEQIRARLAQIAEGAASNFASIGQSVTDGFRSGVESGNEELYAAAIENANTYVRGLDEVFAFGSPSRTTREMGGWIGMGLEQGISDSADGVFDATRDVRSGVITVLRNGEDPVREAGERVMRGFFLGMRNFWVDTIRPFVLDIAVWIRDNKGPISYDRTLLQPAGEAMMQGFHRGLQDGFSEIKGWVGTVGPSLANDGFPKDIFVKRSANFLIGNARSDLDFDPESTFGDLLPSSIAAYAGALDPSLAFLHRTMSLADTKDMAAHLARLYDLQVASLYRPNDRDSRHSIGTAADLSNGYSPTPQMDALARDVAPLFGRVFNQIIWRNKDVNRGWRIPGHMDHVHLDWLKDPNFKLGSGRKGTGIGLDFPGSSELVDRALYQASLDTGVPVQLLGAIAAAESGFRTTAGSPAGAQGLMQLMPATARSLGVSNIFDPFQNARGGATYIARQLEAFNGNLRLALAAYNAGPGAARVALSSYPETMDYVRRVLDYLRRFGGWDGSIGGFRAMGGNVNAGTPYVVGERGRELFIPDQNGSIISNKNVRDLIVALHDAQGMGGGKVIYDQRQVHVQSNSPDSMAVAAQVDARMRSQIVGVHR